jgi:hypothetical protein
MTYAGVEGGSAKVDVVYYPGHEQDRVVRLVNLLFENSKGGSVVFALLTYRQHD